MRNFVQKLGVFDQLVPVVGWVNVDLDHTRVRGDLQHFQAWVTRRRVAFQHDGHAQALCRGFNGSQQVQVVFQALQRRHENVDRTGFTLGVARVVRVSLGKFFLVLGAVGTTGIAHFHAQGSAGQPGGGLEGVWRAWWLCSRVGAGGGGPGKLHHTRGFEGCSTPGFEARHVLGQRTAGLRRGGGGGRCITGAQRCGSGQGVARGERV